MDRTEELLKASFNRLEGLIGEVRELRYKVKNVQGDLESLRAALKGGGKSGGSESGGPGQPGGEASGGDGGNGISAGEGAVNAPGGSGSEAGCGGSGESGGGSGKGGADDFRGGSEMGGRGGTGESALDQRLRRIEERLQYLGHKWLELDEKIYHLQQQNGPASG